MIPQKALHFYLEEEKKRPKYIGHTYIVFEKFDGWYGYKDPGKPIMSRNMRPIPSIDWMNSILEKDFIRGRLIFEVMLEGIKDFSELNGILNRTVGDYAAKNAYLVMHDYVEHMQIPFYKRYERLVEKVNHLDNERVRLALPFDETSSVNTWKKIAKDVWGKGSEGIILKRSDGFYGSGKRNFDLMKIKEEVTLDLLVVGMDIGLGKYSGTLGSLKCKDKKGRIHNVSGMTDEQRHAWWETQAEKESIIGKVVEIKAMKIMKDGSLREPRFKCIRQDKTEFDID